MKTSVFFRMVVLVVMAVTGMANAELKAQDTNFVTNEVKEGDLVTSKVIYRMDGALYRHMKYDFSYDDQKRMTAKEAFKWDGNHDEWVPYFKITYQYANNEITMEYARWNERRRAYIDSVEKSVYELNADNMPVAYMNYKWNGTEKDWSMNTLNKVDDNSNLMVCVD
ncbi:DUF3836 domain-containing protein [Bacteroides sp.]